jgi:hypothetical protein
MSLDHAVARSSDTTHSAHAEAVKTVVEKPDTAIVLPVAAARPLPSPEQAFAEWLLWVPPGADLRAVARAQVAAIDRRGSRHPNVQYLRTLLLAVAGGCTRRQTSTNL